MINYDTPTNNIIDLYVDGLVKLLALRDTDTEEHTRRVAIVTIDLAMICGTTKGEQDHIRRGALLHDIGKIGIPDDILRKKGPLTEKEWTIMHKHPLHAYEMLNTLPFLWPALDIPYCHHEKWDGTGYPRGLKENQIPLAARIFSVVDVWDALLSNRSYRSAWDIKRVDQYLREQSGKHFDPNVVHTFLEYANSLDNFTAHYFELNNYSQKKTDNPINFNYPESFTSAPPLYSSP